MHAITRLIFWIGGALLVTFVGVAIINRVGFLKNLAYPASTA